MSFVLFFDDCVVYVSDGAQRWRIDGATIARFKPFAFACVNNKKGGNVEVSDREVESRDNGRDPTYFEDDDDVVVVVVSFCAADFFWEIAGDESASFLFRRAPVEAPPSGWET